MEEVKLDTVRSERSMRRDFLRILLSHWASCGSQTSLEEWFERIHGVFQPEGKHTTCDSVWHCVAHHFQSATDQRAPVIYNSCGGGALSENFLSSSRVGFIEYMKLVTYLYVHFWIHNALQCKCHRFHARVIMGWHFYGPVCLILIRPALEMLFRWHSL